MKAKAFASLVMALSGSLLMSPLAVPAEAATELRLKSSKAKAAVGATVRFDASVTPRAKGRTVIFQQKSGKRWVKIASRSTTRAGIATIRTRFWSVGMVQVRAVAKKYRGQPQRIAKQQVRVVKASTDVVAAWPSTSWQVGSRISIPVRVSPAVKGRQAWVERKGATGWSRVSSSSGTGRDGRTTLGWTPTAAGKAHHRVYVAGTATHQATRSAEVSRSVLRAAPSEPLELASPGRVVAGSVFEMSFNIDAGAAGLRGAVLQITVPEDGAQLKPPGELSVAPGTRLATLQLGTVPAGVRRVLLRWQAPAQTGEVTVTGRLTASGVSVDRTRAIKIVPVPADSGTFGPGLRLSRESRDAPMSPDQLWGICLGVGGRSIPTFEAARAAAESAFAPVGQAAIAAWNSLPAWSNPELVDEVALTAFADNRPGAALAASLKGDRIDPSNPIHLSNAAAAANLVQRPEWAVAFAQKIGKVEATASVGLEQEAVRLTNLGHAWAMLGQLGKAEAAVREALLYAPQSQQVHQELGVILGCQGKKADALPHVRTSLRADDQPDSMEDPQSYGNSRSSRISASELFDLSGMTAPALRLPPIPTSVSGLKGSEDYYDEQGDLISERRLVLWEREGQLKAQMRAAESNTQPAQADHTHDILRRINQLGDRAVWDEYVLLTSAIKNLVTRNTCHDVTPAHEYCLVGADTSSYTCSLTDQLMRGILSRAAAFEVRYRAYHAEAWPVFSGLQANLQDPVAFELAGVLAEQHLLTMLNPVLTSLYNAARELWPCADPVIPAERPQTQVGGAAASACAPGSPRSRMSGEIDLIAVKLKVSCEKYSLEASIGAYGWLEGFARFEQPWTMDTGTFYVGTKASVPYSGASFENSFYLEMDNLGRVTDVGMEVGPGVEVGINTKIQVFDDKIKMSAMSTFAR